jgi:hypothetical protein
VPEVLPAITLDVEPTPPGLEAMVARLTAFGREHDLPGGAATRLVGVAIDVAGVLTTSPVEGLQAEADIGDDNAQLVLIAAHPDLPERYAALRERLDAVAARCDAFAAQLMPNAGLQVWACFRLDTREP